MNDDQLTEESLIGEICFDVSSILTSGRDSNTTNELSKASLTDSMMLFLTDYMDIITSSSLTYLDRTISDASSIS